MITVLYNIMKKSSYLFYGNFYFPAFNVADASISIGALLLIIDMFYNKKGRNEHENKT